MPQRFICTRMLRDRALHLWDQGHSPLMVCYSSIIKSHKVLYDLVLHLWDQGHSPLIVCYTSIIKSHKVLHDLVRRLRDHRGGGPIVV